MNLWLSEIDADRSGKPKYSLNHSISYSSAFSGRAFKTGSAWLFSLKQASFALGLQTTEKAGSADRYTEKYG